MCAQDKTNTHTLARTLILYQKEFISLVLFSASTIPSCVYMHIFSQFVCVVDDDDDVVDMLLLLLVFYFIFIRLNIGCCFKVHIFHKKIYIQTHWQRNHTANKTRLMCSHTHTHSHIDANLVNIHKYMVLLLLRVYYYKSMSHLYTHTSRVAGKVVK